MALLLLYALPLAPRLALSWPGADAAAWGDAALSLLPLAVVLPSLALPRLVRGEEAEHVARHAVYALAFTVSAATSVRWDALRAGLDAGAEWAVALAAYLGVGAATLWWFCLSHALENSCLPRQLFTHQGDVAVLPLTLVAIARFAADAPDAAFRFSRAIVFYVPVVVAWATLHFVAYSDFATRRVTTHGDEGFHFLARAGLVVAAALLLLLEVNAPPLAFLALPPVAALLCQVTARPRARPRMRPRRVGGALAVAAAAGGAVGALLGRRFDAAAAAAVGVGGAAVAAAALPPLAGARWPAPGALYAALLGATALDAAHRAAPADAPAVRAADAGVLAAAFFLALWATELLAPSAWAPAPPEAAPALAPEARPQAAAAWYAPSRLLRPLARVPLPCASGRYDATTCDAVLRRHPPDARCPEAFRGVWWMEGNPFPMELICVQHLAWSAGAPARAVMWDRRATTRDATLGGLLLHAVAWLGATRIEDVGGGWIRTDKALLPPLDLLADSYWLYAEGPDEMRRLVYDAGGRVVWQYRMLRVARADGARTRHHAAFLAACAGGRYWLAA